MLWTPLVLRYQMEPLRVKDNLIGGVRNVQKDLKVILKGDGSLDGPNSKLVEIQSIMDSSDVGVSYGTNWSQRQPHRRRQECPKGP